MKKYLVKDQSEEVKVICNKIKVFLKENLADCQTEDLMEAMTRITILCYLARGMHEEDTVNILTNMCAHIYERCGYKPS